MQKESVESFVYLTVGIWRGLRTNKQYPTPNKYISERYMPIYGDECLYCPSLFSDKIAKFYCQGLAKHFHKLICHRHFHGDDAKLGNVLQYATL